MKLLALLALAVSAQAVEPSLTIYNGGFAVVRDSVPLDLKAGINDVRFTGATSAVEPDSVILRDPAGPSAWQIREQSYRNDPVSQELLLSLFEGKTIEFVIQREQKPDEVVPGRIVRSGYVPGDKSVQPIIEVGGKLQFTLPGDPRFPTLGDDTIQKPTLSWKIEAPAPAKLNAELAYITEGLSWEASYNIVQQEKGDTLDLSGWITMRNDSGSGFTNARIKLLAGDVSKRLHPESGYGPPEVPQTFGGNGPVVSEKALDEFHVYTLPQATTLNDRETKQVEFLRVSGVKSERTYVYDGVSLANWTVGQSGGDDPNFGLNSNQKVAVYRTFVNSEANKLGIPLPKGTIRFYTQDAKDGSLQFVGENEVDHTAKDEKVRVYVGNSFDLTGERKRTNFKIVQANHRLDESFAITLRNHKAEPVEVSVVERLYRYLNWEVTAKSQDFARKNAQTIEFRVTLKPDEEKTITYTVDYRW